MIKTELCQRPEFSFLLGPLGEISEGGREVWIQTESFSLGLVLLTGVPATLGGRAGMPQTAPTLKAKLGPRKWPGRRGACRVHYEDTETQHLELPSWFWKLPCKGSEWGPQ